MVFAAAEGFDAPSLALLEELPEEESPDDFAPESDADDPPLVDAPSCFDAESLFPCDELFPDLA